MSDWWSYRLDDFLMFAPATYWRLFELYNAALWPGQALALGGAAALLWLVVSSRPATPRWACALLAVAWAWVAWAFLWQRYATINWAAAWFAAAFALQALLLAACSWRPPARAGAGVARTGPGAARAGGLALLWLAAAWPLVDVLLGRPWAQAQWPGLAPDPTVLATLGVLLGLRRGSAALWVMPLAWCAVSGATLWTMAAPGAWALPGAALLALALRVRARHG